MMIRIDDPEIDRLARELARRLGTTVENAVMRALQECLGRTPDELPARRAERLLEIGRRLAAFPDHDTRTADEILGYDEMGLPT